MSIQEENNYGQRKNYSEGVEEQYSALLGIVPGLTNQTRKLLNLESTEESGKGIASLVGNNKP